MAGGAGYSQQAAGSSRWSCVGVKKPGRSGPGLGGERMVAARGVYSAP